MDEWEDPGKMPWFYHPSPQKKRVKFILPQWIDHHKLYIIIPKISQDNTKGMGMMIKSDDQWKWYCYDVAIVLLQIPIHHFSKISLSQLVVWDSCHLREWPLHQHDKLRLGSKFSGDDAWTNSLFTNFKHMPCNAIYLLVIYIYLHN